MPLNTSAMFAVTSVNVHRAGVLAGGGGTFGLVLPNKFVFFLAGLFFLLFDTETDLNDGDFSGDRECLFSIPRAIDVGFNGAGREG